MQSWRSGSRSGSAEGADPLERKRLVAVVEDEEHVTELFESELTTSHASVAEESTAPMLRIPGAETVTPAITLARAAKVPLPPSSTSSFASLARSSFEELKEQLLGLRETHTRTLSKSGGLRAVVRRRVRERYREVHA